LTWEMFKSPSEGSKPSRGPTWVGQRIFTRVVVFWQGGEVSTPHVASRLALRLYWPKHRHCTALTALDARERIESEGNLHSQGLACWIEPRLW
jgi:hypothetical protein